MALQILFGDDEHTAKDGPYSRVLKTRKWIYVSAALAALIYMDLYRPDYAAELLGVVRLPPRLLAGTLLAGGAYLIIQYLLLLYQLWVSYDIILSDRLTFRRADELQRAQDRVRAAYDAAAQRAQKTRDDFTAQLSDIQKAMGSAERELEEKELDLRKLDGIYDSVSSLKQEQLQRRIDLLKTVISNGAGRTEELRDALSEITFTADPSDDSEVHAAENDLHHLRSQNPAARKGYRSMEIWVDRLRLLTPLGVGFWSIFQLGWWLSH